MTIQDSPTRNIHLLDLHIDTLFRLLNQLDPSKPHYLGSPAAGRDGTYFAYGGAGFVLSRGLMKKLTGDSTIPLSVRYQDYAENDCCGDAALGYTIMNETGVALQALYPMFAGDDVEGLKVNQDRWCIPLLALHRVTPEQMKSLWTWERTRPYDKVSRLISVHEQLDLGISATDIPLQHPFTHSTLLDYTMSSIHEAPMRASWDNYADILLPEGSPAHWSASECRSACASHPGCLEYSHSPGICKLGYFAQMGRPVSESDHTSGWMMEKIYELGYQRDAEMSSSCQEATWLKPNRY